MSILISFRKNNKLTNFSAMKNTLLISLIFISALSAQTLKFEKNFGEFSSASSFDIDLNGNFYISDVEDNTIAKLNKNGELIISIGGYGWEDSSFDEPIDIVTTTLSIYVADKNNDRIQRFDKDLNFLSSYNGRSENSEIEFAYPSCIKISKIGDMFLLDSDNNRILKFNLTGEFLTEIGSNDAGNFAFNNPKYFSIDNQGNVYVLDENKINILDQYGNAKISYKIDSTPKKIRIIDSKIMYIENSSIIVFDLRDRKIIYRFNEFENRETIFIIDAILMNNLIYILTDNEILTYSIISK